MLSDVCARCDAVFLMAEGCPCALCGHRHWHDEVCGAHVRQVVRNPFWSWERDKGTRLALAAIVLGGVVDEYVAAPRGPSIVLVVGFAGSAREGRFQVWVRDLFATRERVVSLHRLEEILEPRVPLGLVFEAIEPPPWDYLPSAAP